MKKSLTTGQIAKHCGVNFRTVIRWIERGLLKAYQLPGRGDNRVEVEDFLVFLRENNMPVPVEFQSSPRILVVDDDVKMARAIRRVLLTGGYTVDIAESGFDAGVKIASDPPALITLDLNMPGISGVDVLRILRETQGPGIRVLVVSGASPQELKEAVGAGANAVLEKPFQNDELLTAVRRLMET